MSGPILPPLTVTEVDGSPVGRPITTIKVSNGDLTVSGNIATIDTTGSGGTPGGSDPEGQFNNAGAFGGDSGFTYNRTTNVATVTGGVVLAGMNIGDTGPTAIRATTINNNLYFAPEGSGSLILQNNDTGGGTLGDAKFIVMRNANTDEAIFKFQDATTSESVTLTQVSGSDFQIQNREDNKDLDLIVGGTGIVEIQNSTADQTGTLSIRGNGTGDANLQFSNPTKSVSLLMETNNKITVTSGSNDFVLDVSSASGGITWPDGTTQTSAASGGTQYAIVPPDVQSGLNATYGKFAPIQRYSTFTTTVVGGGLEERLQIFPFTAPKDGTMAAITLRTTGTTTGKDTCNVAIYSPDSDGLPATRMGYLELDMNGGAGLYSSSSWDSAPTLVGGNTYYYATGSSGGTFMTTIATRSVNDQLSSLGFTHYPGTGYTGFAYDTDHTVPATIDPSTELIGVQQSIPVFYFLYT